MKVISEFQIAKGHPSRMEDTWSISQHYIAVFDGATPKTAFRFPDGSTTGQVAAQTLAKTLTGLSPDLTAYQAIGALSAALQKALHGHTGEASGVIYNAKQREIWRVGDCPFALVHHDGLFEEFRAEKRIDQLLSDWRSAIIRSYLSRGLKTEAEIRNDDPGRRIIQPFITRQIRYQNMTQPVELSFGVFDGNPIPAIYVERYPIDDSVHSILLASDGYPCLFPTLQATESHLQQLLQADPLCIGPLKNTKGIVGSNLSFDDRTYLLVEL